MWLIAHEAAHVVQQATGFAANAAGAECERDADRAADLVLAGRTWHWPGPGRATPPPVPVIQRHTSFEHRLLGDLTTPDLYQIAAYGPFT